MMKPPRIQTHTRVIQLSVIAALLVAVPNAFASEWSGAEIVSRSAEFANSVSFDLGNPYICGSDYEYTLLDTNTNFEALVQLLASATETERTVNVEYTGSGCGKVVENIVMQ